LDRRLTAVTALISPLVATAQTNNDSPFLVALITWAPVLLLIGLWIFFMRKMSWYGKDGYKEYMRVSREKLIQIEAHLADIAVSLRKIAESDSRR
jgi:ATP-dependent Zn protease